MTRLRYLLSRLDARDRMMIAGALLAAIVIAFGVGVVTARIRAAFTLEQILDAKDRANGLRSQHAGWKTIR
jgi:hypothetical protein